MSGVHVNVSKLRESRSWQRPRLEQAVMSLERMPELPSIENFTCILHSCRDGGNRTYGKRLHAYMCENGMEAHRCLGNYLIPMLVDCGSMSDAQKVFNRLVARNVYSWTSLITGYIECGESRHALNLYHKMQDDCVSPSKYTFVALLKACARLKDADTGQEIHADVAEKGLEGDLYIGNTLVDMYAKCGLLVKAQAVFDRLPVRDVVSWNVLIAGYAEHRLGEESLKCFELMQLEGIPPDAITFVCSLKACGSIGAIDKGCEIHAEIAEKGLDRDIFVGNTLIDMYAKCGLVAKAQAVFDKLPARDVVSWNALIAGYTDHGLSDEALKCFDHMRLEALSPDAVTFIFSLKACGSIGAIDKGSEIHTEVARRAFERDLFVGNMLVDMYAKCASLAKARAVLDRLPVRDVISWNALIAGYTEQGLCEEALKCFEQMQLEGVCPDSVAYVCSLKACGSIGAVDKGQEIHAEITRKGLEREIVLGSTVVDMYAKCGLLGKAHAVFDRLPVRDIVLWNALITGYAQLGESEMVFHMLERMIGEGVKPGRVTFLSVLTVCHHAGLVDKGQKYFEAMSKDHGIDPTLEHYTCIVDLLGRAGQLEIALAMVKKMPFHPDLVLWHTLLGACRRWGNTELGREAFEHAVQLDEKDPTAYVLMSNIYGDADMQEEEMEIEAKRVKKTSMEEDRTELVD